MASGAWLRQRAALYPHEPKNRRDRIDVSKLVLPFQTHRCRSLRASISNPDNPALAWQTTDCDNRDLDHLLRAAWGVREGCKGDPCQLVSCQKSGVMRTGLDSPEEAWEAWRVRGYFVIVLSTDDGGTLPCCAGEKWLQATAVRELTDAPGQSDRVPAILMDRVAESPTMTRGYQTWHRL